MKLSYLYLLLFLLVVPFFQNELAAQSRRDKEQTYVLTNPYSVNTILSPNGKRVKNVILMIGDGMSLMHVYSAWTANRGKLYLDNCPTIGLSKTYCADRLITDSGAGGTAIATGKKTNYHSVGVDIYGNPLETLIDVAAQQGKSTGVVVTCRLNDATPADFCCHNTDREASYDIAADYVDCGADFVFGGGSKYFENRPDGRNLFNELQTKGYQVSHSWNELAGIRTGKVFCVTDSLDTPVPAERGDLLARASMKAIDLLSQNKEGFFLMIEGSQLDDYGHFNDLDMLMQEVHDFDRTIGKVLEWAANDEETLVVITADHETGGLTLIDGNIEEGRIVCKFSTGGHSGVMVPVYAFGPGHTEFTGIFENTDIFHKIKELSRKKELEQENPILYNAFSHNDYWRIRPLFDALNYRYNCVEADLWAIDGKLYVAHDLPKPEPSLLFENMYLKPLANRIRSQQGKIYPGSDRPFFLMVDFKSEGEATYELLKKELEPYKELFCSVENESYKEGPILLFISGNRPEKSLPKETSRIAFLDGKINELGKNIPTTLAPVISDNFKNYISWDGNGEIPEDQLKKMQDIIRKVHSENKLFRWWGAPDNTTFKRLFIKENIDLIGADDLESLHNLYQE